MTVNKIAKELADLGHSDFRLLNRLAAITSAMEANRARRCEILSHIARMPEAGLDGGVSTNATAPKEEGDGEP